MFAVPKALLSGANYTQQANALVPMDEYRRVQTIQAACYTPIVVLGAIGNVYVITMIVKVFQTSKVRAGVYIYVLCLSLLDLVFLAGSSWLVLSMFFHTWICGQFLCKAYWITETFNKTYSVYILVMLSIDRYRAISKISEYETRNYRAALRVIIIVMIPICLSNLPIYIHSVMDSFPVGNNTVAQCYLDIPNINISHVEERDGNNTVVVVSIPMVNYYMKFMFILYFVVPCSLIMTSYTLLLLRLRRPKHSSEFASSNSIGSTYIQRRLARGSKVVKSILLVVAFYLACWTPYWLFQLTIVIGNADQKNTQLFFYIQTIIYSLPYVNSGLNPILYGFLNRSLRRAYRDSVHRLRVRRLTRGDLSASLRRRRGVYNPVTGYQLRTVTLPSLLPTPGRKWRRLYSQVWSKHRSNMGRQGSIDHLGIPDALDRASEPTTEYSRPENTDSGVYDVWANHRGSTAANVIIYGHEDIVDVVDVETWLLYFSKETYL